jgi:hypothetical protein
MQLEEAVDSYLGEWLAGLPPPGATREWYSEALKKSRTVLNGLQGAWNMISREGDKHLWAASRLLLQRMGEQRRVDVIEIGVVEGGAVARRERQLDGIENAGLSGIARTHQAIGAGRRMPEKLLDSSKVEYLDAYDSQALPPPAAKSLPWSYN